MNNERLDNLFREIREEKLETPISEVTKWIALSAASAGLFGLMSHFKLQLLLTKKILIMTSITAAIGIGITSILLNYPSEQKSKSIEIKAKNELKLKSVNSTPVPLKINGYEKDENTRIHAETSSNQSRIVSSNEQLEIDALQLKSPRNIPTQENITINSLPKQKSKQQNYTTQEREVGHFTKVHIGSSFDVYISQGERDNVRLEVDDRYIDDVITEVKGNELHVKFKNNTKVKNPDKLEIHLTMKTIEGFYFSGAINAKSVNTISGEKLKIDCSGASDMDLDLQFDELEIISSGASELDLTGKANQFILNGSGASEINAKEFLVENSKMTISGASEIKCNVTGDLKISASGASDVEYYGNPKTVDINSSGASSVKKKN